MGGVIGTLQQNFIKNFSLSLSRHLDFVKGVNLILVNPDKTKFRILHK